jgi:hypothetical protein
MINIMVFIFNAVFTFFMRCLTSPSLDRWESCDPSHNKKNHCIQKRSPYRSMMYVGTRWQSDRRHMHLVTCQCCPTSFIGGKKGEV